MYTYELKNTKTNEITYIGVFTRLEIGIMIEWGHDTINNCIASWTVTRQI